VERGKLDMTARLSIDPPTSDIMPGQLVLHGL
jgi:hypothetical protein